MLAVPLMIILGLIVVVVVWVIGIYNSLVGLRNRVKEAWAQVDVQLKRRFDLIPNLMETVKGYMSHERETLEAVTQDLMYSGVNAVCMTCSWAGGDPHA